MESKITISTREGVNEASATFPNSISMAGAVESLRRILRGEDLGADQEPVEASSDHVADVDEVGIRKSYMRVEDIEAIAGQEVEVKIRGGTAEPVTGFMLAMGYGQWLEPIDADIGQFLKAYVGEHGHVIKHVFQSGWPEPFVKLYLGFFGVDLAAPKGITGEAPPLVIPEGTTLAKIRFRVPANPGNMEQTLFMKSHHFKERAGDHGLLRVDVVYSSDTKRGGIAPSLFSGKLIVRSAPPVAEASA